MTLAVCIPCHNYLAEPLLAALRAEPEGRDLPVFLADDGSDPRFSLQNQQSAKRYGVDYEAIEKAKGRSKIRNYLAEKATTSYLLFIDVDSIPVNPGFIKTYLEMAESADVLVGGTRYSSEKPRQIQLLRWLYGRKNEETPADIRQRTPFERLAFNNLMVRRDLFLDNPLLQLKHGYGHEDTLWGRKIETKGKIIHLDNPVYHTGLETNLVFLHKSREAVENLAWMICERDFTDHSRLSRMYRRLRAMGLQSVLSLIGSFHQSLENQLVYGQNPKLIYLQLLKLYWFHNAMTLPK